MEAIKNISQSMFFNLEEKRRIYEFYSRRNALKLLKEEISKIKDHVKRTILLAVACAITLTIGVVNLINIQFELWNIFSVVILLIAAGLFSLYFVFQKVRIRKIRKLIDQLKNQRVYRGD